MSLSNVSSLAERKRPRFPKYSYLFVYGTLQNEDVQVSIFGRPVGGFADALPLFTQSVLEVVDGTGSAAGRRKRYPIIRWSGRTRDVVHGTALRVTVAELRKADRYEGSAYRRVPAVLRSGACAWVYVDARSSSTGPWSSGG